MLSSALRIVAIDESISIIIRIVVADFGLTDTLVSALGIVTID